MMMLQVDNVDASFDDLKQCRENGWKVNQQKKSLQMNFVLKLFFHFNFRNLNHQLLKRQKVLDLQSVH